MSERRKSNRLLSKRRIGDFTNDEETEIDLTANDDNGAGLMDYENMEQKTNEGTYIDILKIISLCYMC